MPGRSVHPDLIYCPTETVARDPSGGATIGPLLLRSRDPAYQSYFNFDFGVEESRRGDGEWRGAVGPAPDEGDDEGDLDDGTVPKDEMGVTVSFFFWSYPILSLVCGVARTPNAHLWSCRTSFARDSRSWPRSVRVSTQTPFGVPKVPLGWNLPGFSTDDDVAQQLSYILDQAEHRDILRWSEDVSRNLPPQPTRRGKKS